LTTAATDALFFPKKKNKFQLLVSYPFAGSGEEWSSLQDTQCQYRADSKFDFPIELDRPYHGDRKQGEYQVGKERDGRIEKGRKLEVSCRDAPAFRYRVIPNECQRGALKEDSH
jgi:hypothetical protein